MMPRYFFDVKDAGLTTEDNVGMDFSSLEEATAEARRAILEIARETLADAGQSRIEIRVRDGDEGPVTIAVTVSSIDES